MEFRSFQKIPRWSRDIIITEKIDGTNAQICITPELDIQAGSRNRWLELDEDNFGFCKWVYEHRDELLQLGPGTHYGEWWGKGIQRGYGLDERRFSLFNVIRWTVQTPPPCCSVVPVLYQGPNEGRVVTAIMGALELGGSRAAPGFLKPEGIVIYHTAGRTMFKKTFEDDETGKVE